MSIARPRDRKRERRNEEKEEEEKVEVEESGRPIEAACQSSSPFLSPSGEGSVFAIPDELLALETKSTSRRSLFRSRTRITSKPGRDTVS